MTINYMEVRQSLVILFSKIVLLEVATTLIFLIIRIVYQSFYAASVDASGADFFMIFLFMQLLNLLALMLTIALWTNKYYRVSPDSISATEGVVHKKSDIISMRTVSGVALNQSFFGRIFNYGVIRIECMFTKQVIYLRNIPKPHFFRKTIQSLIAEAVQANPIIEHMKLG